MHEAAFTIAVTPPFRLDLTAWALRRRKKNAIDNWDGEAYSRILVLQGTPVKITAVQGGSPKSPKLTVRLHSTKQLSLEQQTEAQVVLQKVLGLAVGVQPFQALAAKRLELRQLAEQFIGVRPPRFPTIFEALANAVACQQVSLDAGISLLNRLTEAYGLEFFDGIGTAHAFPRPEDVLNASEEGLRQLGFSRQKVRAIKEVAYAIASDDAQFGWLELASNEEALARLQAIHGIGRWSAEYVLLRGLGRLDVFPGDDIGGQNNVQALLGLVGRPDYAQLKNLTAVWSPYAGFVYFHLLLSKLHGKGLV